MTTSGIASDPPSTVSSGSERVLAQLAEDTGLYATELVEVLVHAQAVRSSADYRILQAASLIHEEREAEYLRRVAADLGTGQLDTPEDLTALAARARAGDDPRARFGPDGLETAICEVGAALTITPGRARQFIEAGSIMRYRLPATGHMLAIGRIDLTRFLAVITRTDLVDDDHAPALDHALAAEISAREPMSLTRFTTLVDTVIARTDPDALRRRRERVDADRHIHIRPDRRTPGQATIAGTLPSDTAATLDARLTAMITAVHAADPRTRTQLRADALIALTRGDQHLPCHCPHCRTTHTTGTDTDPAATAAPSPRPVTSEHAPRPTFHIVVNLSTLLGTDENPAFLDGYGLVDADTARTLLTEARRSYLHPDRQQPTIRGLDRYPIPAKLRALVAAGELCCSFPGCTNPVHTADLDHTDPFNHTDPSSGGQTARHNLKPLCRFHHRHKTFAVGWRDYQTPLGEVFFQSPTRHLFAGNAYTGRDLFTALRGRDKPPDHPGRQHLDRLRTHRATTTRRAHQRAQEKWDRDHPIPF